jgi:hypothetical protein
VFEWGAGASTLWFDSLGCHVVSYETDIEWCRRVAAMASPQCDVRLADPQRGNYAHVPEYLGHLNLMVIDGERRVDCVSAALDHMERVGSAPVLVVLDDSHRREYRDALTALSTCSAREAHYPDVSASLTRRSTSLFLLDSGRQARPVAWERAFTTLEAP